RTRSRRPATSITDAADSLGRFEKPIDSMISREEEDLVWNTIAELPESYREPLVLFYQESHSIQQIALSLDISLDSAKQRLSRGRDMLRSSLAETVEGVLVRARPSKAITLRIMTAVAGFSASSAIGSKAIASGVASTFAGTVAGKSVIGVSGGATTGLLGGMLGAAGGHLGAYLGVKLPALNAPTMTERRLMEKAGKVTMTVSVVYTVLVVLLSLLIACQVLGMFPFFVMFGVLQIAFFAIIFSHSFIVQHKIKQIRATVREVDDPNPSRMRSWVNRQKLIYKGRSYQSKASFLGLPWIDIQVSDAGGEEMPVPKTASGWIAIGDRANGILLGIGGIARGLIAFGGIAYGGIAIGGLAIGLVGIGGGSLAAIAIGGGAIGYQAFGGGAIGWDACGGGAIGWHSAAGGGALAQHVAFGGGAFAIDFAEGGGGSAASFNTAEAKQVVQNETYRWLLEYQTQNPHVFWIVIIVGTLAYCLLLIITMKLMYVRVNASKG
ncbi:MAG TPA: sigma-70 family RNA polymerase sigma factor, partial [Pirellula sp.]|nr:sigma-70 family RNA polymerase sigma factor [Pirellula sp.]